MQAMKQKVYELERKASSDKEVLIQRINALGG